MGNVQSGSSLTRISGALDSYVAELGGDIVYDRSLGLARFLKTVKCRHRNGYLVIKIFIKPDPGLTLRSYVKRLKAEKEHMQDMPNVHSYQSFVETDKAGYLIRQWVASNLYDRISTRPFLTPIERKWITFQLLYAMRDARNRKIPHGDIKSENILVTSWNWVYLSDFASYKPTYLPLDDPADFSFFFDTSGRRTCYIAPERFYTAETNPDISAKKSRLAQEDGSVRRDGKITEAMDCFSVGCVIAELFLEGTPLFTLSQLFKYREGEYSVDGVLGSIEDEDVRVMIKQMINIDPAARPSFDSLLHTARGTVFPESFFLFFHNYVASVNELPPPSPLTSSTMTATVVPSTTTSNLRPSSALPDPTNVPISGEASNDLLPSDSDRRIDKIWADYESVEPYLASDTLEDTIMNVKIDYTTSSNISRPFQDVIPVELSIPNRDSRLHGSWSGRSKAASEDGPALIILALITANIRNCALSSSKLHALDVSLALSPHLTDEAKLDRLVPYVVELLHDDAPIVRASALRTLTQVLFMVTVVTPSNFTVFPEYILPNIRHLVNDPDTSVRCMHAQCIVHIAETAVRYLEMGQALKAHGTLKSETQESEANHFEVSYDASMQELQNIVEEHLSTFLVDPSSVVKRAVLHNISAMCIFLGKQKTNDVILSHMITYLNDRDWLLRYAFFESIVDVAACAGGRSLEEYIYPLMTQALSDAEETVVAKVLVALTSLCELGLFQKMRIWEIMSQTLGFLYHPNVWIRQAGAALISSAVKQMPPSDVWCIVYPSLRHYFKSEVSAITEASLLTNLKPPLLRPVFDGAVQWARSNDKTLFWKPQRSSSGKESVKSLRKGATSSRNRTEEDDNHLDKLKQVGMTSSDEIKLLALRDYITKLAGALSSFASRLSLEVEAERALRITGDVELPKLGVVPQTVFLKTRSDGTRTARLVRPSRNELTDLSPKGIGSLRRTSRTSSEAGAPFEDLRRRLANINNSASSVNMSSAPREPRVISSPLAIDPPALEDLSLGSAHGDGTDRPLSPSGESVVSTATSSIQPSNRLHIGSTDGQKAAPAIGASKASALGLLDAHSKMPFDDSQVPSGASSPSLTPLTHRPMHRPASVTVQPISTYDGQEAGITTVLENIYLEDQRELQQDFGPAVHDGPVRRRNAVRHGFAPRDGTFRQTEAFLVAHLTSHADAVTCMAVAPDHAFFISGSDDETVKVWDTARLERNVTGKPRHTYNQHHAKIKAVCVLEGLHCFASAATNGTLHVVRVHVTQGTSLPKYTKLQVIREHKLSTVGEYITCMVHYTSDTSSILTYATTHSFIRFLDIRNMHIVTSLENPRHYGPITCMCLDRKKCWLIVGTSTGVLCLWDRRFGLLLKSWHVGAASTGRSVRIHQVSLHPTKGKGKWVLVAVETTTQSGLSVTKKNLIEVWDIERSVLVESFVTRSSSEVETIQGPSEVLGAEADPNPSAAIAALVRSRQSNLAGKQHQLSLAGASLDVRTMVMGTDFGSHSSHRHERNELSEPSRSSARPFIISGSDDRRLRYWDLNRAERSTVLSGLDSEWERPSYTLLSGSSATAHIETCPSAPNHSNRAPQRMSLIAHNQQNLLRNHQDIITATVCIDSPFRGGLVSGDRAGVIKVWRIDLGE